jgi:hypothetical protein
MGYRRNPLHYDWLDFGFANFVSSERQNLRQLGFNTLNGPLGLAEHAHLREFAVVVMKCARVVLCLMFASAVMATADVVGTLNVHTALDGHSKTGSDIGQPIPVQVDFAGTQDGVYAISVWSGERQLGPATRVDVAHGKLSLSGNQLNGGIVTMYCPPVNLNESGPTKFQIFLQAVLDDGVNGGKVLVAEAAWVVGAVADGQVGRKVEPRVVKCRAGNNLDAHASGAFVFQNQSDRPLTATLMFGGRKYGDYDLSGHSSQKVQADAWGVDPAVGWYVTTPNPQTPGGHEIQAAGPIYSSEAGYEAGFNRVDLIGPSPTPGPVPGPSANSGTPAHQ